MGSSDDPSLRSALGVAILAGGLSRRMGTDKAWTLLDGRPLIAHVIDRMRSLRAARILIITHDPERCLPLGVDACRDLIPGHGPLGGLHTALIMLPTEHVALVGCDMPYASAAIFERLLAEQMRAAVPYAAVVPRCQGQPQPLHALYRRDALPVVAERLAQGQRRMLDLITALRARLLDEPDYPAEWDGRAFLNLNTPEALAAAQAKR